MAAILGLADEAVEALCHKIHNVWPANYNCPGQLVISGETPSVDEAMRRGDARRRAPRDQAARLRRVPLAARRARRRAAASGGREGAPRRGHGGVHVDGDRAASRTRSATASCSIEQLTAPVRFTQAARELIADGVTTFVEVGPGNVLGGLLKRIDRVRAHVLGQRPRSRSTRSPRRLASDVRVARRKARARHRRLARDRPRDRGGARARRRDRRRRLPLGQGRGGGARGRDRRPRGPGRRLVAPTTRSGSSRRRATSTCSSTTPA